MYGKEHRSDRDLQNCHTAVSVVDFQVVNPIQPWKEDNKLAITHWDFFVWVAERKDHPSETCTKS